MPIIRIENQQHWHDLRARHLGASEIGGLMGCEHSWNTPNQLYMDKRELVHFPEPGPVADFGKIMEPIIAAYIEEEFGWKLEKAYQYIEHPKYSFLGCTLDYYIIKSENGNGIMEIKYVNSFAPGWTSTVMPEHVEWQLQQQLLCVNDDRIARGLKPFNFGCVGSMHGGNIEDLRCFVRQPDKRAHAMIIERGAKFWGDMENGIEPDALEPRDYQYVGDIFKQAAPLPEVKDLTAQQELEEDCRQWVQHGETIAMIQKERDRLKTKIMHAMMQTQKDQLNVHMAAKTKGHQINIGLHEVNHRPQAARVTQSMRFEIKPLEDNKNGKPKRKSRFARSR